jgi:hypothetical protein
MSMIVCLGLSVISIVKFASTVQKLSHLLVTGPDRRWWPLLPRSRFIRTGNEDAEKFSERRMQDRAETPLCDPTPTPVCAHLLGLSDPKPTVRLALASSLFSIHITSVVFM